MTPLQKLPRLIVGTIAGGVLLTNGCDELPHVALPYTDNTPRLYCPGDAIRTSFDLGVCTPHSGVSCESRTPVVTVTTTSAALPSRSVTAFSGSAEFTPTEPRVDIAYTVTPSAPRFPRLNSMGEPRFPNLVYRPESTTHLRIDGEATMTVTSQGVCNGRMAMHAPTTIPGAPTVSPRARARRACNTNMSRVTIDIASASGGASLSASLAPGECVDLPPGTEGGMVGISGPIAVDMRCLSTQTTGVPDPLNLRVAYTCVE